MLGNPDSLAVSEVLLISLIGLAVVFLCLAWKIPSASCIQSKQRQDTRAEGSQDSRLCVRNTHHVYIILGSGKCETCAGDAL